MNRRKFFGAVTAAVAAAFVPAQSHDYRHILERAGYPFTRKGAGFIAARYGSQYHWWQAGTGKTLPTQNFAELETRTVAALQSAWKECLAYNAGDTLIIDEQAYEVFRTLQE